MAQRVGSHLPSELLDRFHADTIGSHADQVVLLLTRDEDGWSRPSMLSYFEIAAVNAAEIRLAIYDDSSAANNLRRDGTITLIIVDAGVVFYVKGVAKEMKARLKTMPHSALITVRVIEVLTDQADPDRERGVQITSGITFSAENTKEKIKTAPAIFGEMLA